MQLEDTIAYRAQGPSMKIFWNFMVPRHFMTRWKTGSRADTQTITFASCNTDISGSPLLMSNSPEPLHTITLVATMSNGVNQSAIKRFWIHITSIIVLGIPDKKNWEVIELLYAYETYWFCSKYYH